MRLITLFCTLQRNTLRRIKSLKFILFVWYDSSNKQEQRTRKVQGNDSQRCWRGGEWKEAIHKFVSLRSLQIGINEYAPRQTIISNASSTTNKVLLLFGFETKEALNFLFYSSINWGRALLWKAWKFHNSDSVCLCQNKKKIIICCCIYFPAVHTI